MTTARRLQAIWACMAEEDRRTFAVLEGEGSMSHVGERVREMLEECPDLDLDDILVRFEGQERTWAAKEYRRVRSSCGSGVVPRVVQEVDGIPAG